MNKELAKTIGTAARQARTALRLTQEDTAERIGVSVEFYARIERGTSLPSILTFAGIVSALGVSADALLGQHASTALPVGAVWTPPPPADSADVRRVLRRLRKAAPGSLRLVNLLLKELENIENEQRSTDESSDAASDAPASEVVAEAGVAVETTDLVDAAQPEADDRVIAASSALGGEAPGLRSATRPRRIFVQGSTDVAS